MGVKRRFVKDAGAMTSESMGNIISQGMKSPKRREASKVGIREVAITMIVDPGVVGMMEKIMELTGLVEGRNSVGNEASAVRRT